MLALATPSRCLYERVQRRELGLKRAADLFAQCETPSPVRPSHSLLGIVGIALTAAMFALARGRLRDGRGLGSTPSASTN
jgi:hypothetical protein